MSKPKRVFDDETRKALHGDGVLLAKRYSPEERLRIVKRYLDGKEGRRPLIGTKRLAFACNISHITLWNWLKKYQQRGPAGLGVKPPKKKHINGRDNLSPREVASIRYGMTGLSDRQVSAIMGRGEGYIHKVRTGERGGPLATPIPTPAARTREEANQWFIHKGIKVLETWIAMLDQIDREGDAANIEKTLKEGDDEGGREHPIRRRPGRPKRRPPEHQANGTTPEQQGRSAGAPGLPGDVRAGQAPHPGQLHPQPGPHRAGGTAPGASPGSGGDPGFIVRKRR